MGRKEGEEMIEKLKERLKSPKEKGIKNAAEKMFLVPNSA